MTMLTVFVDPERCIGCLQCEFACAVEHSVSVVPALAAVEEPLPHKRIHVHAGPSPNTAFPNKCRHCDPAPCLQVCPTGAIYRDPDHDVVLIDTTKCIGCAMCAMVCPFDVLTFYPVDGRPSPVAVKCDACISRLRAGQIPACVEVCMVGALEFGDLNNLVAAGRQRETAAVLAATARLEPSQPAPETVGAWRSLGAAPGQPGGAR
jgi:carbon-monoxide dehydrogenase iron sulfur subunit